MPLRWTNERMEKECNKIVQDWASIVLNGWDVGIYYDEKKYLATCSAQPRYECVAIHINRKRVRREVADRDELEYLLVHELTHGLTWNLSKVFNESVKLPPDVDEHFEEEATTRIAKALIRARDRGRGPNGTTR